MNTSLRIQPTAAAMRAARRVYAESNNIRRVEDMATVIDRETGLPELIAAGYELMMHSACPLGHEKAERWHHACIQATTALEKARKL